jgi:hypothetical protein
MEVRWVLRVMMPGLLCCPPDLLCQVRLLPNHLGLAHKPWTAAPQLPNRQSCQALREAEATIKRSSELEARREALLHLRAQLASKAQVGAARRWLGVV